jgi:hypothetical protein
MCADPSRDARYVMINIVYCMQLTETVFYYVRDTLYQKFAVFCGSRQKKGNLQPDPPVKFV